ncbi:MAG: extracellular solute-binding protein [Clostridiales bacterium]|nr:extracellular solute-binding protein [Clostridiales bacterium]
MGRNKFIRLTALLLSLLMVGGFYALPAAAAEDSKQASSSTRTLEELKELLNTISYSGYLAKYSNVPRATSSILIDAADYDEENTTAEVEVRSNYEGKSGDSLFIPESGTVSWSVDIPADSLYNIKIEYYPIVAKSSSIERVFLINNKVPFAEARYLVMSKVWTNSYLTDDEGNPAYRKDLGGNDLRVQTNQTPEWRTYVFSDSSGYYKGAFEFYFEKGTNIISLEAVREPVVIKSIELYRQSELPKYEDYLKEIEKKNNTATDVDPIYIPAEFPVAISDESIYASNDRTSAITEPQSAKAQLFNVIGGQGNYRTVGQWIRYEFEVEKDGLYEIVARFKQDKLAGMFTSRVIKIDGEILFEEAYNARFEYSKEWQVKALGDGENTFQFYLEKGKHTIELEVGLGELATILNQVENTLSVINDSYLEIMKLTGSSPDKYRDYGFFRIMPNTIIDLLVEGRNLDKVSEYLTELAGEKGSHVATLDKISFLLKKMGSSEDQIARNLSNLKSYIGTLGTWLNSSKTQPLTLDYLQIQPVGDPLPKGKAGVFESIWFEIRSFFNSFWVDYSVMGATAEVDTDDVVEVWIAEGRDQAKVIRNMIDSMFTPQTGIAVNLKLVAGGTLLPSVLSGQGPDVYIGLGSADTINYAIRSAVQPLNDFDGFEETTKNFTEAAMVPLTLYGETYGLPEKMGFPMMFYRQDILANLGIEIPKTWEDVLAAVPILQANNMMIGLAREYEMFLYQMGGDRYADEGMRIGLESNIALEAFDYYCSFYTMYSFPVTYDAANRFRTGEMPIIISDYTSMYNQLTVFATEIRGLWEFVPVPGTLREDGTINNVSIAGVSAVVMLNGADNPEKSWEFMKWFTGAEAQARYSNDLVTTIGPAAKHNTANKFALEEMPWTTNEYKNLMAQFDNLAAIPNYPGSYIVARYVNFAFLAAYNDKKNPAEELLSYITIINKEITRKRKEFNLETLELGETLAEKRAREAAGADTGK